MTPVELYDVALAAGRRVELNLPDGHNTSIFVMQGLVSVNGSRDAEEAELIVCRRNGSSVVIDVREDSRFLILSGQPIGEPIARYGPFVMNSKLELVQAVEDYKAGKMGHLS